MSVDETISNESLPPVPRPLADRICECGCGHSFPPSRRDQVYYNSQHANYGYNHGKRKAKSKNRTKEEKILLKNDNTLDRHYGMNKVDKVADCFFDVIKADKYNFGYHIGKKQEGDLEYFFTYRYYFHLYRDQKGIEKIKIYKR